MLSDKQMNAEQQRNFNVEGYKSEMKLIRQRVKSFETYVNKLRQLTHGHSDRSEDINHLMNENQSNFTGGLNSMKVKYLFFYF